MLLLWAGPVSASDSYLLRLRATDMSMLLMHDVFI